MDLAQETRRDFLRNIRNALQLLLLDSDLMGAGSVFFYVVDFAAIYSYMYKTEGAPFLTFPGEPDERTFARRQIALENLFTKPPAPLLLIPPYAAELKNHLRLVSAQAGIAEFDTAALYKEKLARLIQGSEPFKNFLRVRAERPGQAMDDKLRTAALEIGKEFFPELYAALACISVRGLNTLSLLLRGNNLVASDKLLPEFQEMDYSTETTDEWYRRIIDRRGKSRAFQTQTDAMACTYVQVANRQLNSQQKIIVFVSPSKSIQLELSDKPLVSLSSGTQIGAVRDLTYCLIASIHRGPQGYDRSMINESLATVTSLLDVYESSIPDERRIDAANAALEWKRCENMLLMNQSNVPDQSPVNAVTALESQFLDVLEHLHLAISEGKHSMRQEIKKRLSELHSESIELSKLIPANLTIPAFKSISVKEVSGGIRIFFPGMHDEMPIEILFRDKDVMSVAERFRRLKSEGYSETSILAFRKQIVDMARKPSASPEYHLLAGYILALERKYDASISELRTGCEKTNDDDGRELRFLRAVVHRKLHQADEASKLLEAGLKIDKDEPRLNLEYAKVLWLRSRGEPSGNDIQHCLNEALEHLRIASATPNHPLGRSLRAQIDNVAAYIQIERVLKGGVDPNDGLEEAGKHIRSMEKLISFRRWTGRFFDTRGYWYFAQATMLSGHKPRGKRKLLENARRDIQRALEFEEEIGMGFSVRREHQSLINNELARLRRRSQVAGG